jgi:hypothetical protein
MAWESRLLARQQVEISTLLELEKDYLSGYITREHPSLIHRGKTNLPLRDPVERSEGRGGETPHCLFLQRGPHNPSLLQFDCHARTATCCDLSHNQPILLSQSV